MAQQTFDAWVKKQSYKPTDKITNWQKLTSPYLLNKYITWGEVYAAAGLDGPVTDKTKKENTTTTVSTEPEPEFKTPQQIKRDIADAKEDIKYAQYTLGQIETRKGIDSPEYKAKADEIARIQKTIKETLSLYKEASKQSNKVSVTGELAIAEEDLKRAKATGDATEIQKATNAFAIARNAAVRAGVKSPSGGLLGSEQAGGVVGTTVTPEGKPTSPTPTTTVAKGTTTSSSKKTVKDKVVPGPSDEEQRITALDVAATDFSLPETIFKNVPSLNRILKQYVDENWTEAKLRKAIRDDNWYRKNSAEIKTRYVQKFNYDDLVATGQADGSTDYEMQISKIERKLAKRAAEIGSSAANDPASLRKAAENLYITNRSEDTTYIDDFLAASIKTVAGMIGGKVTEGYSGEALDNYKALVKTARDNGFQVSDILPGGANEQQVLQGIASGKIDIDRVKQDARKLAAQGQPQYVRDLLAQGYDLSQVFEPYRQTMATVLDINDPEQIDLNDPLLRTAITDKGDMNLYDFKKALRQDERWQYTTQAQADVSNAAFKVLRDFGFQG